MDLRIKDLVTLDDDREYVITSIAHYDGFDYCYLIDINNNENFKFCKLVYRNGYSCLVEVEDDTILQKIIPLLYSAVKNEIMA